jgi:hypothetical protein
MLAPDIRSCEDCQRYWYDDGPDGMGKQRTDKRTGLPVPRPKGTRTPCHMCPRTAYSGVPPKDRSPKHAVELSEQNKLVLLHYQLCRAVNDWPRGEDGQVDPLVQRNARLIQLVEDAVDRQQSSTLPLAHALLTIGRKGR